MVGDIMQVEAAVDYRFTQCPKASELRTDALTCSSLVDGLEEDCSAIGCAALVWLEACPLGAGGNSINSFLNLTEAH